MKILFVRSGNGGIDPISTRQGISIQKKGVEVSYFDIIGKGFKGYINNLQKLRQVIKKENPDIIHAHYSLSGFLAVLTLTNKPIITSLMGSDVLKTSRVNLLVTQFFSNYLWSFTIVKSKELFRFFSEKKSAVIPNGVDMELFKPVSQNVAQQSLGWSPKNFHILFASNPARPEKNFNLANAIYNKIKAKYPETQIHYLMNLNDSDVVLHYNAADILLLTSHHEGSPNVIKEAMACNCPIAATNVGDISEITNGTENVTLIPFESDTAANAVLAVLETKNRSNGQKNIMHLSSNIIADRLIALYNKILLT